MKKMTMIDGFDVFIHLAFAKRANKKDYHLRLFNTLMRNINTPIEAR